MEEEWNPLPPFSEEEEEKKPEPEEEIVEAPIEEVPEVEPEPEPEVTEEIEEIIEEIGELAEEVLIDQSEGEFFFQKLRNARRTGLDARQQEVFDKFDLIGKKNQIQVDASLEELDLLVKLGRIRRVD